METLSFMSSTNRAVKVLTVTFNDPRNLAANLPGKIMQLICVYSCERVIHYRELRKWLWVPYLNNRINSILYAINRAVDFIKDQKENISQKKEKNWLLCNVDESKNYSPKRLEIALTDCSGADNGCHCEAVKFATFFIVKATTADGHKSWDIAKLTVTKCCKLVPIDPCNFQFFDRTY